MTPNVSESTTGRSTRQDGRKLRAIREQELLLTTRQAADKIGCSHRTLQALETERRSASNLMMHRISRGLGVTTDRFERTAAA